MTRTTMFLQLLMCSLLIESSIQAAMQAANGDLVNSATIRRRSLQKKNQNNICELEQREAPLFCSCNDRTTNYTMINATEATCVIFSDKLKVDSPIWNYFAGSQSSIEVLSLTVKSSGILDYIPTNGINSLQKLRKFSVKYANLSQIDSHAFYDMHSLVEINLDTCEIKSLEERAFDNMDKLHIINLRNNSITVIKKDVFINLNSLSTLFLQRNKISVILEKAFQYLNALKELDLSENSISVITTDTFNGLKNLETLNLAKNSLEMIGDNTFIEMPELKQLDLGQNKIRFVSENALNGMRNLIKLDLSENELVTLEKFFLSGASAVTFLDLRGNKLKTMPFDNVKPIALNLYGNSSHIFLDDNELICDCELAWIWGLRNETKNLLLKNSLESLQCFLEIQKNISSASDVENNITEKITNIDREENPEVINGKDEESDINTEEYENYSDSTIKPETDKIRTIEGKLGTMKYLSQLKLELLPCVKQSLEDQEESSRTSSRRENSPITSSSSKVQFILGSKILFIALAFII